MRSTDFRGALSMPGVSKGYRPRRFDQGGPTSNGALYIDPGDGSGALTNASPPNNSISDAMSADDYGTLNKAMAQRASENQALQEQSYRKAQDAYTNALTILQKGRASQGMNLPLLAFAAGLGSPTNTGSFGESLSRGLQGALPAIQQQRQQERDYASDVAKLQAGQANLGMQYAQQQGKSFQDLVQERLSELGAQAQQKQAAANLAETAAYHKEMEPMYQAEAEASRASAAASRANAESTRAGIDNSPTLSFVGDANEVDPKTGMKLGWFRNDDEAYDPIKNPLVKRPYGDSDITDGKKINIPSEVQVAQWLTKASPEEVAAYRKNQAIKSGTPEWATENNAPPSSLGNTPNHPGVPSPPAPGSGPGASTKTNNPPPTSVASANGLTPSALDGLPTGVVATIKGMIDGRVTPPSSLALKGQYWQAIIAKASEYDPLFDETTWHGRVATRRAFDTGQPANNITAINTAIGHAGDLMDSFDKLNNFGGILTLSNAPVNYFENKVLGDKRLTSTQENIDALAAEARRVFAGQGGGSLTELEKWEKNFPINGSPEAQKDSLKKFTELLAPRLNALTEQYNRGMQRTEDPINLLNPQAREVFIRLNGQKPTEAIGYQTGKPPVTPVQISNQETKTSVTLPPINERVAGKTMTPDGKFIWNGNVWIQNTTPAGQ